MARKSAEKTPAEELTPQQKARKRRLRALRSLLIRVAALALVVYVLFFHLVGLTVMPSGDMYPRLDAGDLVLYYRLEPNIRAQDIVVLHKPASSLLQPGEEAEPVTPHTKSAIRRALDWLGFRDPQDEETQLFICRVVAGPGDTVEITDTERLLVNGNAMIESNIFYTTPQYGEFVTYPLTLGADEYFVLADHRSGGEDSRFFGPVKRSEIDGAVITILRRNNL